MGGNSRQKASKPDCRVSDYHHPVAYSFARSLVSSEVDLARSIVLQSLERDYLSLVGRPGPIGHQSLAFTR